MRGRKQHHNLLYHEFDFPEVANTKRQIVEGHGLTGDEAIFVETNSDTPQGPNEEPTLYKQWGLVQSTSGEEKKVYHCHPLDLRQLPSLRSLESLPGLRSDLPTLIVSECCLCYLEVDTARDVINWFKEKIPSLGIVLYEPIGVDDAFGQMMVENLAARGIVMPTVKRYKTLIHQVERLAEFGFKLEEHSGGAHAETIENIWQTWIPENERERVDSLEGLDEVEEWQMLARHYAIVWGWTKALQWDGRRLSSPQSAI